MFRRVGSLVPSAGRRVGDEDMRHWVQGWLRRELRVEQVYCERFADGVLTVRSPSPAVRAAVKLAEFDLGRALVQECDVKLVRLSIRS